MRWRFRRWRCRHYVRAAEHRYRRQPTAYNLQTVQRARLLLYRTEVTGR
jgi:hypothetical protein